MPEDHNVGETGGSNGHMFQVQVRAGTLLNLQWLGKDHRRVKEVHSLQWHRHALSGSRR